MTSIRYPRAIWDEQTSQWISDVQIAEVPYTAFASSRAHRTAGRLVVRRVEDQNPKAAAGQSARHGGRRTLVIGTGDLGSGSTTSPMPGSPLAVVLEPELRMRN